MPNGASGLDLVDEIVGAYFGAPLIAAHSASYWASASHQSPVSNGIEANAISEVQPLSACQGFGRLLIFWIRS